MENLGTSMLVSIAPFVALLVLWFVLLRQMRRGNQATRKNLIDPMREMLQTVVVPEIRALQESVEALRADLKARDQRPGQ